MTAITRNKLVMLTESDLAGFLGWFACSLLLLQSTNLQYFLAHVLHRGRQAEYHELIDTPKRLNYFIRVLCFLGGVLHEPRTEKTAAGLSSFVCLRVKPLQRCSNAVFSGQYVVVFFIFFAASFGADRSLDSELMTRVFILVLNIEDVRGNIVVCQKVTENISKKAECAPCVERFTGPPTRIVHANLRKCRTDILRSRHSCYVPRSRGPGL